MSFSFSTLNEIARKFATVSFKKKNSLTTSHDFTTACLFGRPDNFARSRRKLENVDRRRTGFRTVGMIVATSPSISGVVTIVASGALALIVVAPLLVGRVSLFVVCRLLNLVWRL
jgi:hypothetical protein